MSNLIVIRESLHNAVWLYESLGFASEEDAIVLVEDAVSVLNSNLLLTSFLAKCEALRVSVYAVEEDLQLRGVQVNEAIAADSAGSRASVKSISAADVVGLLLEHDKQVAWQWGCLRPG